MTTVTRFRASPRNTSAVVDQDPITTEVIRCGLDAAADQMRLALRRTAFSPVIYEITDFAAALYDREGRLLAQGASLPIFLGTLGFCLETSVARIGGEENIRPGDVLLTTYGYDTGSHPQDAAVVVPGFFEGELMGYAVVKAHHLDLGAKSIYCTDTTDVFQEGTIFPSVRLYSGGELQDDMYRTVLANSRLPKAFAGDLSAQIGAAKTGLEGLYRLIDRVGADRYRQAVEMMFDHGESIARSVIDAIPDGRYVAEGAMDNDGITDDPVPFEIAVEISGEQMTVDFTGVPDQQVGPINCPVATTVSACRLAVMALTGGRETANEGFFRPIEVVTREGTMFHPISPAPIFLYAWPAVQAVDVIHRALAQAIPEQIPAGSGGDVGFLNWWGEGSDGSLWSDAMDTSQGQGATHDGDGGSPVMHIGCSGTRAPSAEVWEARHAFVVDKFECATDSAGAGKYRGGLGIDVYYRALEDCFVTSTLERTVLAPWGLDGGVAGRPCSLRLRHPDGRVEHFNKGTGIPVPAGAVLEMETGGGGGFGAPEERTADAVAADVREGYISQAAALRDYPHLASQLSPAKSNTNEGTDTP
jgi:N-methylhydantoinase B